MGDVISLSERRRARRGGHGGRPHERMGAELFFDLACPFAYLVAERVDRAFDVVVWTPVPAAALRGGPGVRDEVARAGVRRAAEERAAALRMPLVWPERFPDAVPAAMRVAAVAAHAGRGAAFVLAAGRLAFCGGFDLEDPEILADAAAAAGLSPEECLAAAGDAALDAPMRETARRLASAGADRTPVLSAGGSLCWGEDRVGAALTAARVARVAQA